MAIIIAKTGEEVLVDDDKFEDLSQFTWSINKYGYAYRWKGKTLLLMHRYLTDCPKGLTVDHVNMCKLDNRLENLEIVTQSENMLRMWDKHPFMNRKSEREPIERKVIYTYGWPC